MSTPAKAVLLALTLALLGAAGFAGAEIVQKGTLRVGVSARLQPRHLPRSGSKPIALSIRSRLTTTDSSVPQQLKSLRIEVNRHGHLDTQGLPECQTSQIQPASTAAALKACRPALVGEGSFSIDVVLGGQEPYPTKGRLLLFNGRIGCRAKCRPRPALLAQIYAAHPFANSFVIPFRIEPSPRGRFGIALTARLPAAFISWGHITSLQMRLHRRYRYRGRPHSFLSAGCPAPEGIAEASFTLARISLSFAGGTALSQTLTDRCRPGG